MLWTQTSIFPYSEKLDSQDYTLYFNSVSCKCNYYAPYFDASPNEYLNRKSNLHSHLGLSRNLLLVIYLVKESGQKTRKIRTLLQYLNEIPHAKIQLILQNCMQFIRVSLILVCSLIGRGERKGGAENQSHFYLDNLKSILQIKLKINHNKPLCCRYFMTVQKHVFIGLTKGTIERCTQ